MLKNVEKRISSPVERPNNRGALDSDFVEEEGVAVFVGVMPLGGASKILLAALVGATWEVPV